MTVSNVMTREIVTLELDSSLGDAKFIFENNNFHHILVLDDDLTLAGMLTDRDLYKHLSPSIGTQKETREDAAMLRKKVHQVMTRKVITGYEDLSLNEAAFLFYKHHISCLPIVNLQDSPIGIITWRDIIKVLAIQFKRKQEQLAED